MRVARVESETSGRTSWLQEANLLRVVAARRAFRRTSKLPFVRNSLSRSCGFRGSAPECISTPGGSVSQRFGPLVPTIGRFPKRPALQSPRLACALPRAASQVVLGGRGQTLPERPLILRAAHIMALEALLQPRARCVAQPACERKDLGMSHAPSADDCRRCDRRTWMASKLRIGASGADLGQEDGAKRASPNDRLGRVSAVSSRKVRMRGPRQRPLARDSTKTTGDRRTTRRLGTCADALTTGLTRLGGEFAEHCARRHSSRKFDWEPLQLSPAHGLGSPRRTPLLEASEALPTAPYDAETARAAALHVAGKSRAPHPPHVPLARRPHTTHMPLRCRSGATHAPPLACRSCL